MKCVAENKIKEILRAVILFFGYLDIIYGFLSMIDVLLNRQGTIHTAARYICIGSAVIYIMKRKKGN